MTGTVVVSDEKKRANRLSVDNGLKENRDPQVLVSQKTLTPRPHSSSKSPIEGWGGDDNAEKDTVVGNGVDDSALHNNVQNGEEEEEFKGQNVFVTDAIENGDNANQGKAGGNDIGKTDDDNNVKKKDSAEVENRNVDGEKSDHEKEVTEKIENLEIVTDNKAANADGMKDDDKVVEDVTSVQKTEVTSELSDNDKTEVKTEDYLGK
ncbi:uncharacterized protein LOC132726817 [Ruditapes philippinarum]|uniref:uncharacterized protein LOC132726817 n=1 Tax=Ruditapes philippinarum TaxID=129788 RepID=UPI00295C2E76|nr:uncharacterized protein LOC132726817 [Ruditapes philippinarum]